tara:strand:+ start:2495 stop:3598 length:1104 start_codon:yes stop_codon:yes gene_type:complete
MITNKIKVLFLFPYITHYRDPIFCDLSKKFDLTVGHSGVLKKNKPYKQIKIPIRKIGSTNFHQQKTGKINLQGNLKIFNQFDIIVSEMNLRFIDRYFYILLPSRKFAWVCWGIGITAPFKKNSITNYLKDFFRIKLFGMADSLIFYSRYPLKYYKKYKINTNKLFVANNTVKIKHKANFTYLKNIFLFVGTLYKQKGLDEIIDNYKEYLDNSKIKSKLIIIGDGPDKTNLIRKVHSLSLSKYIIFINGTSDEKLLKKFYDRAIMNISLNQAGLSVLSSFAYGVPFVTMKNSATGGERFNIKDKYNGLLLNKPIDLVNVFQKSDKKTNYFIRMGKNAYQSYLNTASYQNMISNIASGIIFAIKKKKII